MADPNVDKKIKKVQIVDLEKPQGSEEEIDDKDLDKIKGGGTYGYGGGHHYS